MRRNERQPKQLVPYSVEQYVSAGCSQLVRDDDGLPDAIGLGIHTVYGGLMCNDCPLLREGCGAFARLHNSLPRVPAVSFEVSETVREEAARRGLSINEVRRQRHAA